MSTSNSPIVRPSRTSAWLAVALVYVIGSIVFLWPMPAQLTTHIWGDRFDAWTTLWLMDHVHRHLSAGTLAAQTTDIMFPVGYNLWSFGHAALQLIGVGFMFLGIPLVPAYNLLLIGGFASSGLAAHALGRSLSGEHLGGFTAGATFASSPYLYGEGAAGCVELVAAGFLPLFALTLVHLARRPRWRQAATAAFVLAIIGPFNWYYTLFAGMLGLGFAGWQLVAGRWRVALWMLGAMACAGAADAPLIPLVRRETPIRPPISAEVFSDRAAWERVQAISNGALPLAELTPETLEEHDAMQVLQNSTTVQSLVQARFTVNPLQSTPGMLAFVVGACGLALSKRRGAMWAAIALAATTLTLGPFLRLDDTPPLPAWSGHVPLPYYYFYQYVPFFSKAYRPYRIGVVALTCCAALGAAGFAGLALEIRRGWLRLGVGLLGLLSVSQPFWSGDHPATRALYDATIDETYYNLAKLSNGGVIEVPLQYQPLTTANARFQYNQVAHRMPTLNCNQLIRRTDLLAFQKYVTNNAFLSTLLDLARQNPPFRFTRADVARTAADGFGYVVIHTSAQADDVRLAGGMTEADLLAEPAFEMLEFTLGTPVLQDDETRVYAIPTGGGSEGWTWTGEDVAPLTLPIDTNQFGLPLSLAPGISTVVWEGDARQISFWGRAAVHPDVLIRIRSATGEREETVSLASDSWRWVHVPVVEHGPVTVTFAAADAGTSMWITHGQVLR